MRQKWYTESAFLLSDVVSYKHYAEYLLIISMRANIKFLLSLHMGPVFAACGLWTHWGRDNMATIF